MKSLKLGMAALVVAAFAAAPVQNAKADGGATAVGIGAYLVVDYVVGRKCRIHHWPLNIIKKIAYGVHGKRVCKYKHR